MRLSAMYIPSGVLPHIFGKDHNGVTINLGGKYLYTFEEKDEKVSIKEKSLNQKFVEPFWLNGISLVSAIVGENGTGKTSILDLFRNPYSFCSYVYESLEKDESIISENNNAVEVIYYSAFFNMNITGSETDNFRDLSKYQLMLDDTEYERLDLSSLLELHRECG